MTSVIHRPALLPDLFGWLEGGWPFATNTVRVEEFVEDDRYVVRAELPGFDPDKDIRVSAENGRLVLTARRTQEQREHGHSEFRYGSFARVLALPVGVRPQDVKANYRNGILEVSMPADGAAKPEPVPIEIDT